MKLSTLEGAPVRAKRDEEPKVGRKGMEWKDVEVFIHPIDGTADSPVTGKISGHWLYFPYEGQFYKVDVAKYQLDTSSAIELKVRQNPGKMTDEEKKAKRAARRAARKAAKAAEAGSETTEESEEESEAVDEDAPKTRKRKK